MDEIDYEQSYDEYEYHDEHDIIERQSFMPEIEKNILIAAIEDTDFRKTLVNADVKPEFFEDLSYQYVYNRLKDFTDKYQGNVTQDALITMLRQDNLNMTKVTVEGYEAKKRLNNQDAYVIVEKIGELFSEHKPMDKDFLVAQAELYFRDQITRYAIYKSKSFVDGETNDRNFNFDEITNLFSKVSSFTLVPTKLLDITEDDAFEKYYHDVKESIHDIPFKSETFNKITGGGLKRGSLALIGSFTNQGKSVHLVSHMLDYVRMGYNVLYISLELSEHEVRERCFSNIVGEHFMKMKENIKSDTDNKFLNHYQNRFRDNRKELKGVFRIKKLPEGTTRVSHIDSICQNMLNEGINVDILIVDHLNNIESGDHKNVPEHIRMGNVARQLTAISSARNMLTWTAVQLNRSSVDSESLDLGMLQGSIQTAQNAGFAYLFKYDSTLKKYQCNMVKTRTSIRGVNDKFFMDEKQGQCQLIDTDFEEPDVNTYKPKEEDVPSPSPYKPNTTFKLKLDKKGRINLP